MNLYPDRYQSLDAVEKPGLCVRIKLKFKVLWSGLKQKPVAKFILFLIL